MVRNIQLKHSGKYVCMVHTEIDTVSAAADLIVRGMLFPPYTACHFVVLCMSVFLKMMIRAVSPTV